MGQLCGADVEAQCHYPAEEIRIDWRDPSTLRRWPLRYLQPKPCPTFSPSKRASALAFASKLKK